MDNYGDQCAAELLSINQEHTQDPPSNDFSWLVVATDKDGEGWVLDAAQGYLDCDMFDGVPGYCRDNCVPLPKDAVPDSLYKVTNARVKGGVDSMDGEHWYEVNGDWELVATAHTRDRVQ